MTKRTQGNAGVKLVECTNPVRNKWRVRWDIQKQDDGSANYMETEFDHHPSEDEIRSTITKWYNEQTDSAILSGFEYEGVSVWLSKENQYNYKAAYDLAVQTNGATLPVTFKFGTDSNPVYRTFDAVDSLADFWTKTFTYIQNVQKEGWMKKDAVDMSLYMT